MKAFTAPPVPLMVTCNDTAPPRTNNSGDAANDTAWCRPRRTVISFVNGIHHSLDDCREIAARLGEIFGDEVRAFYNPSSGNWFSDASRAGLELFTKPGDLVIAKGLAAHLRRALRDVGARGRVLHLAHSGGAIMTYLAAKHHLRREETARIDLVTFGGGRSITRKVRALWTCLFLAVPSPVLLPLLIVLWWRPDRQLLRQERPAAARRRPRAGTSALPCLEPP